MISSVKPISAVTENEFRHNPVWEFIEEITSEAMDESWAFAMPDRPVTNLAGRVVASEVTLANGSTAFAVFGNIDCLNAEKTSVFLNISFMKNGLVFHLAWYFDCDFNDKAGATALASFLGLQVADIFPIKYDLTHLVQGNSQALRGVIPLEPARRLSDDERMKLIFS